MHHLAHYPVSPPEQALPWGVDRIDAEVVWGFGRGYGVKAGILDTGIDLDHSDLAVVGGYNAINPGKSPKDDNGHGTHVAGIVAALDNFLSHPLGVRSRRSFR